MTESKIIWQCVECGAEIEDGAGYVEYDAYGQASFAGWRAVHRGCDPDIEGSTYWIAVERLDTWARLAQTREHLDGKQWFSPTDWPTLLDCVASSPVQSGALAHPTPSAQGGQRGSTLESPAG